MKPRFHKFILTLVSLVVLFHSISLYAETSPATEERSTIEMNEDIDHQETQLQAYDALIPTFHDMAPLVLYFLSEVVLLNEAEYQDMPIPVSYQNRYLEILFPLIISPNAP